jgi:hypothetical protein
MRATLTRKPVSRLRVPRAAAAALAALWLSGCASGVQTPLPEMSRPAAASMSLQEHQKAVTDLQEVGRTHDDAAERQIESSR